MKERLGMDRAGRQKVGEEKKKEGQVKKEVGEQKRYRNGDDTINYESNGKCSMNRQS